MSDQILSQEEVNLILQSLGKEVHVTPKEVKGVRPLDLSLFEKISVSKLPGLELIVERWANNLRRSLMPIIVTLTNVYKEDTQVVKFFDFLDSLPTPSAIAVLSAHPLRENLYLILDPKLVYMVVSLVFGGSAKPSKIEGKEFTRVELRIIQKLCKILIDELKTAMSSIIKVDIELLRIESEPILLMPAKPKEKIFLSRLVINVEGNESFVYLAIPKAAIEPFEGLLKGGQHKDTQYEDKLIKSLVNIPVNVEVVLGSTNVSLEDVLLWKAGDTIIILDNSVRSPLEARVEGITKMLVFLGQVSNKKAFKFLKFLED
ncbi:flagellar motor switch protein FliM [Thermocrinis minervae]|uniref:Flagellar motor switch protein FliM n=1 Tax=Thermocrinis minervae TaxID=381751 RepID=A0A1M6SL32_9AQUI|nr:FliM/FliN family flagellar motor switch protein [Thermocrinis minervae]SHK45309.1 flagellar motor switch protein FliM [Thermocrinis minervae]